MATARAVGRMREQIQIFMPIRVSDGALGFNREETVIINGAWGRVQASSSSEIFAYQHLEQRVTHTVTMRYDARARQGQHLRVVGKFELYIEAVVVMDERQEFMKLVCRQGGNL